MASSADPAAMRAVAARLRLKAEQLVELWRTLDGQIATFVFAGPGADRLRESTAARRTAVARMAEQLGETATAVLQAADRVEMEQAAQAQLGHSGG
jgi:hypothetical protein